MTYHEVCLQAGEALEKDPLVCIVAMKQDLLLEKTDCNTFEFVCLRPARKKLGDKPGMLFPAGLIHCGAHRVTMLHAVQHRINLDDA